MPCPKDGESYRFQINGFSVVSNGWWDVADIDPGLLYPSYPLEDFKRIVQIDDLNDTVTVTQTPYGVDPANYEFGIIGGTRPDTWGITSQYVGPVSGQVAVREKGNVKYVVELGTLTAPAPRDVVVTKRTPRTATLKWSAPISTKPPKAYEIYRKPVDRDTSFGQDSIIVMVSGSTPDDKAGSTTDLTFTDQGLTYNEIYEYRVRAVYENSYVDSAQ